MAHPTYHPDDSKTANLHLGKAVRNPCLTKIKNYSNSVYCVEKATLKRRFDRNRDVRRIIGMRSEHIPIQREPGDPVTI